MVKSITRRIAIQLAATLPFVGLAAAEMGQTLVKPAAPFAMPSIAVPDFSASPRFLITAYGADTNDIGKTSAALSAAIAAAHQAGSGVVVVPPGLWPTRAIHLKSNVNLHLEKGAVLIFSERPEDYLPAVPSSWEGIECLNYSPLIYAYDCENVALSGEGKIFAKLDVWQVWYQRPKPHMDALIALYQMARQNVAVSERNMTEGLAHLRPQFVQFNRCRNVLIEDISIENSPFWTLHPFLCRDVVIRRVKIRAHGHNNDGIDPEMSQNVLIEDCVFDQGDDAVSVKSGRDMDAWRIGVPAKNIVMRNCLIKNGHQLMAIGSELSAGIENVHVTDCRFERSTEAPKLGERTVVALNNLLYVKTNERRGGYVKNISLENIEAGTLAGSVLSVETDVLYQWKTLLPTYIRKLTPIEGLAVRNVSAEQAKFLCYIKAESALPVRDVSLHNVKVKSITDQPCVTENVEKLVYQP